MAASLSSQEAELLRNAAREVAGLLESGDRDNPCWARLFPRAYLDPTEEEAELEWQSLVHDELLASKRMATRALERTLGETGGGLGRRRVEVTLTVEEAEGWLAVLNDARLALGTQLGVSDDLDMSLLDPRDPKTASFAAYSWLGWAEEHLVQALWGS